MATPHELENSRGPFAPFVVGVFPTTMSVTQTSVSIDAVKDPDVYLVATFAPATNVAKGIARVGGKQEVTEKVFIQLDESLPLCWLASILAEGEIAPNYNYQLYTDDSDDFELTFPGQFNISHKADGWHIPTYNSDVYTANVGFGFGGSVVRWAYSVQCGPVQTISIPAGDYQLVRSDGQAVLGAPVDMSQTVWSMPMGSDYTLTFDASGNGVLSVASFQRK